MTTVQDRVAALLLVTFVGVPAFAGQAQVVPSCVASPLVRDTAPRDPSADPVGPSNWYVNADRTLWAGPVPNDGWPAGGRLFSGSGVVHGQKTYWVRPKGTQLMITGRRIDATAPEVEANVPCCYTSGFQIVALHFPSEGCWEVTATAGGHELRFVTQVRPSAVMRRR